MEKYQVTWHCPECEATEIETMSEDVYTHGNDAPHCEKCTANHGGELVFMKFDEDGDVEIIED